MFVVSAAELVADAVGHRDPPDVAEIRQEVGDVEDRGDRLAPARLADHREVGDRESAGGPATPAIRRSWVRPSPCQPEPSTTSRSAIVEQLVRLARLPNGGSSGHQTVTGRSWMSSGATIAVEVAAGSRRRRSGGSSRRRSRARRRGACTQWAWIWASSQDGPSGSAGWTIVVRDGWRPVSRWMIAAQRSPTSGRRGDHDEVHHARPGGDVALARSPVVVDVDRRGSSGPRSGRAPARPPRCCGRATASAAPARPGAGRRGCRRSTGRAGRVRSAASFRPSRASSSSAASGPHVPAS